MEKYHYSKIESDLIRNSSIPMAVYQFIDKRVVTIELSQGFMDLFGFDDPEEAYRLMDNDMYRYAHPDDRARISEIAYRFAVNGGEYDSVYRSKSLKEREYRIIHARGKHEYRDGVRLAVIWYTDEGIYSDDGSGHNSQLNKSLSDTLHRESMLYENYYDSLTGLPNMTYFFQLADAGRDRMIENGRQPAMVFFDLNGMKLFNGKYGFSEGDKLLKAFAKVLVSHFSIENCGRFGQDHFVVYTEDEGLTETLEEIFEDCRTINNGRTLPVRAGIYLKKIGHDQDAGIACDKAKAAADVNRNSFESCFKYFDDKMLDEMDHRRYIIENLDRAISEKWIKVYYQPIIRAANDKVCDEEALARWIDPIKGFLSPAEFIPVLEESRLIYKLDLYVVEQILEKIKYHMEAGLFIVPQSVNLSRHDFGSCDIVEEIRRRVDDAGISHDKLTIEITESVVGSDFDFMKLQVERFHELGFNVWMDDFGSDYSSLDYLQSIPFDLIKLDMRFMKQFNDSEKSRVIITELVRMAMNLGLNTVTEGVETREQVDFLKEIGCTKLQGYYYCKPIPPEEIVDRNLKGIQIGFENPEESEYYEAIGRINLYDLSAFGREESESLQQYFNTLPMAIVECAGKQCKLIRSNKSFRDFIGSWLFNPTDVLLKSMQKCCEEGSKLVIDEELDDGRTVHTYLNRIAVDPVTGTNAVAMAILAVIDKSDKATGLSYTTIARALSGDYFDLFYVNIDTEEFVHYSSNADNGELAVERHGRDFFAASRSDAIKLIYKSDQKAFIKSFTKEIVLKELDAKGSFTHTYRLMLDGVPTYVSMKARYLSGDDDHIIIGVSNVDSEMRHKEELEKVIQERVTYSRIAALGGDYIAFYTVDPDNGHYTEYSSSTSWKALGIAKSGTDFFNDSRKAGISTIYPQDLDMFLSEFTMENVLNDIKHNGMYDLPYRLMIDGTPTYVSFRIALIDEKDGPSLIVGIVNIDAIVRQDSEQSVRIAAKNPISYEKTETGDVKFKYLTDHIAKPCAVLSVEKQPDGTCGEIRIVRANSAYRETMGDAYHDNMIYSDLVPKDIKFEDFCFRAAHLGKRMRSYVETKALDAWTDFEMIPLVAGSSNVGYCMFIFEYTKGIDVDRLSGVSANTASIIMKSCIKLLGSDDFKNAANSVLEDVRRISEAFNSRILLIDRDKHEVTNYCVVVDPNQPDIGIEINETVPYEIVLSWDKVIETTNAVIIKDEHDMKSLEKRVPVWVAHMRKHNIRSLINIPLFRNKEVFGYLYLTNFNTDKVVEIKELLELLSLILGAELSNSLLMDRLELLLRTDPLTGISNRYAMLRRISEMEGKQFGIISLDLNGLKRENDEHGHDAGDRLLIQVAEILSKVFYKEDLYRTGGDEFIVLSSGISKETFERKLNRLNLDAGKNINVSFAIGSFWSDGSVSPNDAFIIADNNMYDDKKKYYEAHPELKIR